MCGGVVPSHRFPRAPQIITHKVDEIETPLKQTKIIAKESKGKFPRGVLEFGYGGGVQLTTQNSYPFLGVILAENSTRF